MATRKRFQPLSMELGGYLYTFIIIYVIVAIAIYIVLGLDKWAFYGAISLGLPFTIVIFLVILWFTGVEGPIQ